MKLKYWIVSIVLLTVIIVVAITACISNFEKEENSMEDIQIEFRGGDALLDLLGKNCIPDSLLNISQYCNSTEIMDTILIDSLLGYPGCTFTVVVYHYLCIDLGLMDIRASDYQILEHDCQKFSDELSNLNYDPELNFIKSFDALIYPKIEEYFMNKYMLPGDFLCGSGAVFNIIFYRSSCYKYCVSEEDWGRGRTLQTVYKTSCGEQCCERRTYMCEEPDGSIFTATVYVEPVEPTCDELNSGLITCYGSNIVWESGCVYTCQ